MYPQGPVLLSAGPLYIKSHSDESGSYYLGTYYQDSMDIKLYTSCTLIGTPVITPLFEQLNQNNPAAFITE
jgi:hypothetical protein